MQNKNVCSVFPPPQEPLVQFSYENTEPLVQFSYEKTTTYFSKIVKWEMLEGFVLEKSPVPTWGWTRSQILRSEIMKLGEIYLWKETLDMILEVLY